MSHHRVLNLSQLIAMLPARWNWLVRNAGPEEAAKGKFFVHVYQGSGGRYNEPVEGRSFQAWADTPEQAFETALRWVLLVVIEATRRAEEGTELNA